MNFFSIYELMQFPNRTKLNGFNISTGERQYLGDGVYFFESSLSEAEKWAKKHHSCPYAIIKAVVDLGYCLDLVDEDNQRKLRNLSYKIKERKKLKTISDAAVINFVASFGNMDTVRGRFFYALFPGSHIFSDPYIVICVRNTKNILNHSIERIYS